MLEKNAFPGTFEEWQNLSTDQKEYAHFSLIHQVCETVSNVQSRVTTLEEQMRAKNWKRGILSGSIQFVGAMVGGGAVLAGYLFLSGKLVENAAASATYSVIPAATQGGGNMIGGMEILLIAGIVCALGMSIAVLLLDENRSRQIRKQILKTAQEIDSVLAWWEQTDDRLRQEGSDLLKKLRQEAEWVADWADGVHAYNRRKGAQLMQRIDKILGER